MVMSAVIAVIQYLSAGSGWREGAIKVELKLRFYTSPSETVGWLPLCVCVWEGVERNCEVICLDHN